MLEKNPSISIRDAKFTEDFKLTSQALNLTQAELFEKVWNSFPNKLTKKELDKQREIAKQVEIAKVLRKEAKIAEKLERQKRQELRLQEQQTKLELSESKKRLQESLAYIETEKSKQEMADIVAKYGEEVFEKYSKKA